MKHVKELISRMIDDDLTVSEQSFVKEHLRECKECKDYYEELSILKKELSASYLSLAIPRKIEESVLHIIMQHELKSSSFFYKIPWLNLMILSFVSFLFFNVFKTMLIGLRIVSTIVNISMSLVHTIPFIISNVPYLYGIIILFAVFMLVFSILVLRRLLYTRPIGRIGVDLRD